MRAILPVFRMRRVFPNASPKMTASIQAPGYLSANHEDERSQGAKALPVFGGGVPYWRVM
jgi:hypothetical protein